VPPSLFTLLKIGLALNIQPFFILKDISNELWGLFEVERMQISENIKLGARKNSHNMANTKKKLIFLLSYTALDSD